MIRSNFLDANVWLALLWSRHIHSEKARVWLEEVVEQEILFCRFTQIAVLRLLTTEKLMGKDTRTMAEAWDLWDRIESDDRVGFVSEPADLEKEFRGRSRLSSASPKVWADSYLLAFAAVAGLRLVTFDKSLKAQRVDVLIL